jgi:antitoxin component of MazEF toxin-antitoxin module
MYDELTARYSFACPDRGEARVLLSDFRELRRLPGTAHPAVYSVRFACACGGEHDGLVTHEELDWAPLGLSGGVSFLNLMTARIEALEPELAELAAARIRAGEWPWSFFCYPENQARPVSPSSFFLLAPSAGAVGLAVRCPACTLASINLVSEQHVDLPFHNDAQIGVVEHVFAADAEIAVEEFAAELDSARFETARLALE